MRTLWRSLSWGAPAFLCASCGLVFDPTLQSDDAPVDARTPLDAEMSADGDPLYTYSSLRDAGSEVNTGVLDGGGTADGAVGMDGGSSSDAAATDASGTADGAVGMDGSSSSDAAADGATDTQVETATVVASEDDALEDSGGMLVMYEWASLYSPAHYAGMRFVLDVPPGSTILATTVRIYLDSGDESYADTEIYADDVDDAADFSSRAVTARTGTSGVIHWDSGGYMLARTDPGTWMDTPDLSSVVQEIVDRPGWAAGNHLALLWHHLQDGGKRDLEWRQWDYDSGAYAASIRVEYIPP